MLEAQQNGVKLILQVAFDFSDFSFSVDSNFFKILTDMIRKADF